MITSESSKNRQRFKTMAVFINNCLQLMEEEGLEGLSIRKVANRAGYNSATIYHYFSDFEELIIFACLKHVDAYAQDISQYLNSSEESITRYLKIWECFCRHSFSHPQEFTLLFFKHMNQKEDFSEYFSQYYEIFPESQSKMAAEYSALLEQGSIYDREVILLSKCLDEAGYKLSKDDIYNLCEMNLLIYRGILALLMENPGMLTVEDATKKAMNHIRHALKGYSIE